MATFGAGYQDYLEDLFEAAGTPGTTVAVFEPKFKTILANPKFNINTTAYGYDTLLIQCVNAYNLPLIKYLIETKEYGVEIDAMPKSNCNTALIIACEFKDHQDIALYLIDKGADINRHGCINVTPLMRASKYGLVEVVKSLLANSVEIDATFNQKGYAFNFNGKNKTALYRALEHNQPEIVALLMGAGAKEDKETLILFPVEARAKAVVKTTKNQIAFLIDALDADTIAAFKTFIGMLSDLENTQLAFITYGGGTRANSNFGNVATFKATVSSLNVKKQLVRDVAPGIGGSVNLITRDDFEWDVSEKTYKAIVHFGSSVIDMAKITGSLNAEMVAEFVTAVKKQFSKIANENIDFITVYDGKPEYRQTAEIFQQEYNKSSRGIFDAMVIEGNDADHLATVKQLILDHSAVIARGATPMPKANLNAPAAPLRSGGAGSPSLPPASSSAAASVRANGGAGGAAVKAPAAAPLRSGGAGAPGPTLAGAIAASAARRAATAANSPNGKRTNGKRTNSNRNTRKNAPTLASVLTGWTSGTPIPEAFFKEENIDHINTSTVATFTAHITSSATYEAVKALRDLMKGDPKSDAKTAFRSKLSEVVNTSPFK